MQCSSPKYIQIYDNDFKEYITIAFPCGKCYACQCRQRAEMALRVKYEIQGKHCVSKFFVTLTYDNEHLPMEYCDKDERDKLIFSQMIKKNKKHRKWNFALLDPQDFSLFLRRLQRVIKKIGVEKYPDFLVSSEIRQNRNCRYVATGEY